MRKLWSGVLCMLLALGFSSSATAAGKVLLVQSYHQGYSWSDDIAAGVRKGLQGSGATLEVFYMDTKRKTSEAWKVRAGTLAKERVAAFKPDVVIAADDNAQSYFAKDYVGHSRPQIVFCGVNAEASAYGYPAANVTGILERPFFVQSLELLRKIKKNVRTIALITDDGPTSDAIRAYIKTLKSPLRLLSLDQPSTFHEWQTLIAKYQETADAIGIIAYQTVKKTIGAESMDPKEVMAWTIANTKRPTVGFFDFAMRDGVLCGIAESGEEHGLTAAEITIKILRGKKAGDFPIRTAQKGKVTINLKTAQKLGLDIPAYIVQSAQQIIE